MPLSCLWKINSQDTSLAVIITCLKRTLKYDFCVRVTAYPLGAPNVREKRDLVDHHLVLRSLTDGRNLYEAFLELHLISRHFEILIELIDDLHFMFY